MMLLFVANLIESIGFLELNQRQVNTQTHLQSLQYCTQVGDITIAGISNMLMACLRAHELHLDAGIDPISLTPLDVRTNRSIAASH
jgi:hypothetical protein